MGQSREIVVTGGGTGIGYAVAAKFAAAGESVTITGRREDVLAESAALLGAKYVAFDAADATAVERALAELPERVDVLVNNAGGNTDRIREKATDLAGVADAWRANYEANVLTAVLVTTALQPRLAERARVVTIGSIAAKAGSGSYGAAKAALESWNVNLAKQLGTSGATANIVAPGVVLDTEFFQGTLDEQWLKSRTSVAINQRAGQPDEVADAIIFLAGAGAGHITGQVLHVNGGAHLGS
ncbi:SDR family NAD(P)-dependent oxidoreductase [Amycolatopsis sp. 195334CR]|uniref:SDR family NAD(P)-dependent oxidoreductase n=1 Tax=Amycolatopsis sp. 195334CR TaxID=2814588 RepID=UPI001A8EF37E|nr:SDR family oxidoreductase [Amycolatopsis sp. 195334CR]MBN6034655.1 SDR family oxidoreductase [Amycolatopsis sp. 195334CR]